MKLRATLTLKIFVAAAFAALITFGCAKKDADEQVLDRLRTEGQDLTKAQAVDFFLYFEKEPDARKAADQLKALGFQINLHQPGGSAPDWCCRATQSMVPSLETLRKLRGQLDSIATAQGGVYDGWSIGKAP